MIRFPVGGTEAPDLSSIPLTFFEHVSDPQTMWDSWDQPFRRVLVQAVDYIQVQSVYEVGCGSGPSLRLLRFERPQLRLGGSEPSTALRAFAEDKLKLKLDNFRLPHPVEGWDVTLTWYTLAYLDIHKLLDSLLAIKTKYLISAEPFTADCCVQFIPLNGSVGYWSHDYTWFLKAAGWRLVAQEQIHDAPNDLNQILIAERIDG